MMRNQAITSLRTSRLESLVDCWKSPGVRGWLFGDANQACQAGSGTAGYGVPATARYHDLFE